MREIKFRAWHKEMKYMSPVGTMCFDNWAEIYIPEQTPPHGEIDWQGGKVELEKLEIMQFTGLHDKNGKEIYEGDVVSYSRAHYRGKRAGHKGTIVWSTNEPALVIFSRNALEQIQNRGGVYFSMSNSSVKNVEILGNIYNNPELLEANDE